MMKLTCENGCVCYKVIELPKLINNKNTFSFQSKWGYAWYDNRPAVRADGLAARGAPPRQEAEQGDQGRLAARTAPPADHQHQAWRWLPRYDSSSSGKMETSVSSVIHIKYNTLNHKLFIKLALLDISLLSHLGTSVVTFPRYGERYVPQKWILLGLLT